MPQIEIHGNETIMVRDLRRTFANVTDFTRAVRRACLALRLGPLAVEVARRRARLNAAATAGNGEGIPAP